MNVTHQPPKMTDREEDELRAFCASCGLSDQTIERAITARRNPPLEVMGHAKRSSQTATNANGAKSDPRAREVGMVIRPA
jgi:hypothetical protein